MRDWQRLYRLSKARWHYQLVRLDHDDAEALRTLAGRDGTTATELIRTFIVAGAIQRQAEGGAMMDSLLLGLAPAAVDPKTRTKDLSASDAPHSPGP